jgi:carboxylesterase
MLPSPALVPSLAAQTFMPAVDPRPIVLSGNGAGVLLLHGLTGTPHEVRPMAEALHAAGYAVRAPLLAGHTDLGALERSTWRDWYASAREAFEALQDSSSRPSGAGGGRRPVIVLGFSMGSLLALRLAALHRHEVAGVVAISVMLRLPGWKRGAIHALARMRASRLLRDVVGVHRKRSGGSDIRVQREVEGSPSLRAFPYPTLCEFVALQEEVTELLPHVRAPTLLLHGRFDHTAPVEHSELCAQRLGAAQVWRQVLPRSFHVVGLDLDRDRVCAEVVDFATRIFATPPRKRP